MTKRSAKTRAGSKPAATKRAARAEPIEIAPAPPRKRGRPSSYDPSFCERVIELGEQGKSRAQIASALGISRQSLYRWLGAHPEFAEAMKEAEFAALAWWEDVGQAGLSMPKFNAALYAFNMKNRFREFYADKVDVAHTGNGEPEQPEMSDLELARRVAFILARGQAELRRQQQKQKQGEGAPQTGLSGLLTGLVGH